MGETLVINDGPSETRVALVSNGVPVELFVERDRDRSVVGNVYRGKVVRVLPGMQAAFVEVGLDRTAFLSVDDAIVDPALLGSRAGGGGFRGASKHDIGSILKSG
ncbi:MAG: Rne/Rng family ribonuclease, partial [Myxococcota bacterium]